MLESIQNDKINQVLQIKVYSYFKFIYLLFNGEYFKKPD